MSALVLHLVQDGDEWTGWIDTPDGRVDYPAPGWAGEKLTPGTIIDRADRWATQRGVLLDLDLITFLGTSRKAVES